jgi:hypothetical protein
MSRAEGQKRIAGLLAICIPIAIEPADQLIARTGGGSRAKLSRPRFDC